MAHLLVIDDDPGPDPEAGAAGVSCPVPSGRCRPHGSARAGSGWVPSPRRDSPRPALPDQSGLEVYRAIRQIDARIPVIFVTIAKSADAAIEAMQQGAFDYLFKPIDLAQLQMVDRHMEVSRRMREPAVMTETLPDSDVEGAIVGICPGMREVYKAIGRVAGQNVPVLITGESGTGKELVALAIYQHGLRARESFLTLNCGTARRRSWKANCWATRRALHRCRPPPGLASSSSAVAGPCSWTKSETCRWPSRPKSYQLQDQVFERLGGNETVQNQRAM